LVENISHKLQVAAHFHDVWFVNLKEKIVLLEEANNNHEQFIQHRKSSFPGAQNCLKHPWHWLDWSAHKLEKHENLQKYVNEMYSDEHKGPVF